MGSWRRTTNVEITRVMEKKDAVAAALADDRAVQRDRRTVIDLEVE